MFIISRSLYKFCGGARPRASPKKEKNIESVIIEL